MTAAHFEHGIRGEESLRDARFVETWCREQGIPFVLGQGDAPSYALSHGMSLEQAARELRYAFLRNADEIGAEYILTAHNLDDNAETLLFNLARGSGTAGLCGIPARRGEILRPLLPVSRAEIEAYLEQNHVPHVEDSTNREDCYTRNLIRHRAIPALRAVNPRFDEAAARTAALAARDEDCLSAWPGDFLRTGAQDGRPLPGRAARLHPAVASRAVRRLLPGLSMEHAEAGAGLLQGSDYGASGSAGPHAAAGAGPALSGRRTCRALPPARCSPARRWRCRRPGCASRRNSTLYPRRNSRLVQDFFCQI